MFRFSFLTLFSEALELIDLIFRENLVVGGSWLWWGSLLAAVRVRVCGGVGYAEVILGVFSNCCSIGENSRFPLGFVEEMKGISNISDILEHF